MKAALTQRIILAITTLLFGFVVRAGEAVGTGFSYSGSLVAGGSQANGWYDLKFTLFDAPTNGTPVAASVTNPPVLINNGLFNATLDFGAAAFNGDKRWLEIGVRTNGNPADFETLVPRQELTPQPYALFAATAGSVIGPLPVTQLSGSLPGGLLAGTYTNPVTFNNPGNSFSGNGSGLIGVNAFSLGGLGVASFWQTTGNSRTTPGVNFVGTTDNQPLELKVKGQRALRLEPTTNGPPNLIGGAAENYVAPGISGATIGGGGASGLGESNSVVEDFGIVGGGSGNSIQEGQLYGTIAGGHANTLIFWPNQFWPIVNNTIGGGFSNTIFESDSVICGGAQNSIGREQSFGTPGHFIGGGVSNIIDYELYYSTIVGGHNNFQAASESTIGGGSDNTIWWSAGDGQTIAGGERNQVFGDWGCTISGGTDNSIGTKQFDSSFLATISGGQSNVVKGSQYAAIGGGFGNLASARDTSIPGGAQANARLYGQMAYASGQFSSPGDAQTSVYVCRGTTTNATQTELFLDGASAPMVLSTNSTWSFEILITGRAANGDSAAYRFLGAIKNNAGVVSLVGSPLKNALGQDVPSWDANISPDAAHQALALNVTGASATSIRWVAKVRTSEVMY